MGHLMASRTLSIEDGVWMGASQDAQQTPHHKHPITDAQQTPHRQINQIKTSEQTNNQSIKHTNEGVTYNLISKMCHAGRLQVMPGQIYEDEEGRIERQCQ